MNRVSLSVGKRVTMLAAFVVLLLPVTTLAQRRWVKVRPNLSGVVIYQPRPYVSYQRRPYYTYQTYNYGYPQSYYSNYGSGYSQPYYSTRYYSYRYSQPYFANRYTYSWANPTYRYYDNGYQYYDNGYRPRYRRSGVSVRIRLR